MISSGTESPPDSASPPRLLRGIPTRTPDGRARSAEEIEREWVERVYRGAGDQLPQLTARAVVMGALLGAVMALTNLYVGLRIGWTSGVAITACILSYAIWRGLRVSLPGLVRSDFSILENNCMQSTATAAGFSVGGTMASAIAALLMITGRPLGFWPLLGWNVFLAVIGVAMAVPMKRQMINVEQLPFPSGTAAAETLRSLHRRGGAAMRQARALGIAGLLGAIVAWLRDATFAFMPWNLPAALPFGRLAVSGLPLAGLTLRWDMGLITIGAGALVGFRVAWSLLLGALLNYLVLVPWMARAGVITASDPARGLGFGDITRWSLWTGVPIMVLASFVALGGSWRTLGRAFSGIGRGRARADDPLAAIEVPRSWFLGLFLFGLVGAVALQRAIWGIPVALGVVACLLTFALSVVACRVTGETDTTPTGALGKITQLAYGVLAPSNMTANIMTASVTANASGCAADLLTDLKSGYLLGANARQQFLAQLAGVLPGAIAVGLGWSLLVPNASVLGTEHFPASMAVVWKGVAELLSHGLGSLHPTARAGALTGAAAGLALPLLERAFPRAKAFIPSPIGLGLAFVMPGWISISMFAGALAALLFQKARPRAAEEHVVPIASGLIAGESLMAIVISALMALGVAQK
ncbi:MAG TPA: OPT family oligopeptide transporter [Terriglobales bacterium]|nr:OPT family oligopeptide transporter [Terriglobales bacterium]